MSADSSNLSGRAEALRREFDESFGRAGGAEKLGRVELLAVRVGNDPHAIRLSEIAGLHADRRITRVPGPLSDLLGIVSLRGAVVPVYDLRPLLGYPSGPPPRWLVVASSNQVGLAFDHLEGHVVASADDIVAEPGGGNGRPAPRQVLRTPDGGRSALLSIPSLMTDIAARARRARPHKER